MVHAYATYHIAVCRPAFHVLGVGSLYVHGVVADGPHGAQQALSAVDGVLE